KDNRCFFASGKIDFECCSVTRLARNADRAGTLFDNAENGGQAEPGSFAGLFCAEERLEDAGLGFLVHSDPRVAHGQHYAWTKLCSRVLPNISFIGLYVRALDGDLSAMRHCIVRIDYKIHQHLLDLDRIGMDRSQVAAEHVYQLDFVTDQPAQQRMEVIHGCVQVQRHWIQLLPATEHEKALREIFGRCPCIVNLHDHLAGWFGQVRPIFQNLAISENHTQKVVEVMGDTPGQLADRLHFLGLPNQLFVPLGTPARRNVANIALDDLLAIHSINIAYELHADESPAFGLERQIFITDIQFGFQLSKSRLGGLNVPEQANLPERHSEEFLTRIVQELH